MAGFKNQAFVTIVLRDEDVQKALSLSYSLRHNYTIRKIYVLASQRLNIKSRDALNSAFDYVTLLEEDRNDAGLPIDDFAKFYLFAAFREFKSCVYLSPTLLSLKKYDEIFEEQDLCLLENGKDTSIFCFQPSLEKYHTLVNWARNNDPKGHNNKSIFYNWLQFNNKNTGITGKDPKLSPLYVLGRGIYNDEPFVDLIPYPDESTIGNLTKSDTVSKIIGKYWLEIQQNHVQPLLRQETVPRPKFISSYEKEPVAIIGMSCRYPKSNNLEEFWQILDNGEDATGLPNPSRFSQDYCSKYFPDAPTKNAGFLKDPLDQFDAKFFDVTREEATFYDPQHRVALELVWEGLENAGINPQKLKGTSASIFMGTWRNDFKDILKKAESDPFYRTYMGNSIGAAAARISHLLGISGPSVGTESGCSSGMVAVHLARQSLQLGETNLALACGVNLLLDPWTTADIPAALSADGHCKTFSYTADGFCRSEGAGVLVLKRLSDALADGDRVLALIRGSAVAQEGISKNMGTPTVKTESMACMDALKDANVLPEEVSFVEAHGSGTVVGDPIEVAAISAAYKTPNRRKPLVIGSVKTNVGHTESTSGITGMIKTVLSLQNEKIPKHLNFIKLNPLINLDAIPAVIPLEPMTWRKVPGETRIAGVSSFGITGTDVHVIVEEAPANLGFNALSVNSKDLEERPLHILKLSAKSEEALNLLLEKYLAFVKETESSLADIAFTANTGRADFPFRAAILARNGEDFCKVLETGTYLRGYKDHQKHGEICFIFTGQHSGLGEDLYKSSPTFKIHFDYCKDLFQRDGIQLVDKPSSHSAIFTLEYSLFKLWQSWGVKPNFVLGCDLGEITAAVCAEIISLEDGVKLVAGFSKLVDKLKPGKIVESEESTTIHKLHSKEMDSILDEFKEITETINLTRSQEKIQLISGMKGGVLKGPEINSEYWANVIKNKVNFLKAGQTAVELGSEIFIELAPHPIFSAGRIPPKEVPLSCLPSLQKDEDIWSTMLTSLGKLYTKGVEIKWSGLDKYLNREKVPLPLYPFIRSRYWPDMTNAVGKVIHPLIGSEIRNATQMKIYESKLTLGIYEYIRDHKVGKTVVYPGACYLEMCLAAGLVSLGHPYTSGSKPKGPLVVENLDILEALALNEHDTTQLQTVVVEKEGEDLEPELEIKIYHRVDTDSKVNWVLRSTATSPVNSTRKLFPTSISKDLIARCDEGISGDQHYARFASVGLNFGAEFRSLERYWENEDGSLLAKLGPFSDYQAPYITHPITGDAMIQALWTFNFAKNEVPKLFIPVRVGQFEWLGFSGPAAEEPGQMYVYCYPDKSNGDDDVVALLVDSKGTVIAGMREVVFVETTTKMMESSLKQRASTNLEMWEGQWRQVDGPLTHSHDLGACIDENFDWKEIREEVKNYDEISPEMESILCRIDKLCYLYILRAFYQCGFKPVLNQTFVESKLRDSLKIKGEHTKLFNFFLGVLQKEGILKKREGSDEWQVITVPPSLEQVEKQLSPAFINGLSEQFKSTSMFVKIGEDLKNILQSSDVKALDILFPQELTKGDFSSAEEFYGQYAEKFGCGKMYGEVASSILADIRDFSNQQGPDDKRALRILEVGAGTGSYTKILLEELVSSGVNYEYTYTDKSPAFFTQAEKKFEKYIEQLIFKKLDITADPIEQNFMPASYDIVLSSEVIHATPNLKQTSENVKILVKPGGQFHLIEQTQKITYLTFVFGCLPQFWAFEDSQIRKDHCTISAHEWAQVLEASELKVLQVFPCLRQRHSVIISRRRAITGPEAKQPSDDTKRNTWIIFHDENSPASDFLQRAISTLANRHLIVVTRSGSKVKSDYSIRPDSEQDFIKMFETISKDNNLKLEGILYSWTLRPETTQEKILKPFFHFTKSLLNNGSLSTSPLNLTVLTKNVAPFKDNDLSNFHTSTVYGFMKTLYYERTNLKCRCVDIGGTEDNMELMQIFNELWNPAEQIEVGFQAMSRYNPKLSPIQPLFPELSIPAKRFQLILPETKTIADLKFGHLQPFTLASGQVEIEVKSAALNFRDVLSVLKPSADFKDSNMVGFDFAGVVVRSHPNCKKYKAGDTVCGVNLKFNALPSHINLHEDDVVPIPQNWTFSEASTLPTVVTTVYYSLIDIGKVKQGDTVLIHTASGGVGLAAIQICEYFGAKVIATAGSKRKQDFLRSLGVEHVFNSRDTTFEENILKLTDGAGVDIVLNTLTSPGFKEATLAVCGKGARFVELSKLNIWTSEEVADLRPDVEYALVDMLAFTETQFREYMTKLKELIEAEAISALPHIRFHAVNIRDALEYLQKARHVGKVVCTMPQGEGESTTSLFHSNATYLITGGFGGIGFAVCKWMLKNGAKQIVLVGRSEPSLQVQEAVSRLNYENSSRILTVVLDVANFPALKTLIETTLPEKNYPLLRGVMHCAGTLCDGFVENQSWDTLSSVFGAKIDGTWNLHELTKDNHLLEHFILFSSFASVFGQHGQSNHAAGNSFEDGIAHYRHSIGLPATSINWGIWGEVGVATKVTFPGMKPMTTVQALGGVERALKYPHTQIAVLNIESIEDFQSRFTLSHTQFDESVLTNNFRSSKWNEVFINSDEVLERYNEASNETEKQAIVMETLRQLFKVVMKSDTELQDNEDYHQAGMDSLMFVELKNGINATFGTKMEAVNILKEHEKVETLSETLVRIIDGDDRIEDRIPTQDELAELIIEDAQLSEDIKAQPHHKKTEVSKISKVLLTGVTGTLGPYVLRELSKRKQITEIYCIIRASANQTELERLKDILQERDLTSQVDITKVKALSGNVALEMFGLEPEIWEKLSNEIDAVFHIAAIVNHIDMYTKSSSQNSMRTVNVGGLKEVLQFCCSGIKLKHLYHASSIVTAVTLDDDETSLLEEWPEPSDIVGLTGTGYTISKFIGDLIIKEATLQRGIPCKVFRFPLITGDSETGRFILKGNHMMLRMFFSLKHGLMANSGFPMLSIPVDISAKTSVDVFFHPEAKNTIYHVLNDKTECETGFKDIAKNLGYNVSLVDRQIYNQKVQEKNSGKSHLAHFTDYYAEEDNLVSFLYQLPSCNRWREGDKLKEGFFTSKKVAKLFPEHYTTGMGSKSSLTFLEKDFIFAREQGWFEDLGV